MEGRMRLKTVLIGDPGVSKTNLMRAFRNVVGLKQTIRIVNFGASELEIIYDRSETPDDAGDNNSVLISIWDTCGKWFIILTRPLDTAAI